MKKHSTEKSQLTELALKSLKSPLKGQDEYFDIAPSGFGLRVSYKGTKTFFVVKRVGGRKVRFTLGTFPHVSLKDARTKAVQIVDSIADGVDPRVRVREARRKVQIADGATFKAMVEEFFERYAKPKLRNATLKGYTFALKGEPTARWQDWPIASIAKSDVKAAIDKLEVQGNHATARVVRAYLRKFFAWCVDKDIIAATPVTGVKLENPPAKRDRALSLPELVRVWRSLACLDAPNQGLIQTLILTGQRIGETRLMRWQDISDLDGESPVWNIPATITKNKKPHVVPLVPAVVKIIKAQNRFEACDYVFTHGVTAMGTGGKNKATLDKHLAEDGEPAMAPFTWHDLRRSFVTGLNDGGIAPPHVIEAIVNHISGSNGGVAGVYNKAQYLPERRKALEAWAKILRSKLQLA